MSNIARNIIWGIATALIVAYAGYQTYRVEQYSVIAQASSAREKINDDNFRDLLGQWLTRTNEQNSYNQGKLEGIVLVVNKQKPDESEHSQIWHNGYQRGLDQNKDIEKMAYEKGRKDALEGKTEEEANKVSFDEGYTKGYLVGYHKANEDQTCPATGNIRTVAK